MVVTNEMLRDLSKIAGWLYQDVMDYIEEHGIKIIETIEKNGIEVLKSACDA